MPNNIKLQSLPQLEHFFLHHDSLTLAVIIDKRGTVHASAMLYYCTIQPLRFYFVTSRNTDKYCMIKTKKVIPCAAVVGTERGTSFSVQIRGNLKEINVANSANIINGYYKKLNNKYDNINDPTSCLLKLTPSWVKFTDYNKSNDRYLLDI